MFDQESLLIWMEQLGFPETLLEIQGETLIVKLPQGERNRLLADTALRGLLVRKARDLGFSRVTVEL